MQKEFTKCSSKLSQIPYNNYENIKFHHLFDMLVNFCGQGNSFLDIGPSEELVVRDVAKSNTKAAVYAQSILASLGKEEYKRIPERINIIQNNARFSENNNEITNVIIKNGLAIPILDFYPNPFTSTVMIEYHLPENTVNAELIISDLPGRAVQKYKLSTHSSFYYLYGYGLVPGMYIMKLIADDVVIGNVKLIYQK